MPRISWLLLIVALAGLLLSRESRRPGPIGGIDRAFFDWLCANAHAPAPPPGATVTLVEIDDAVIDTPRRWPFSPLDYALFLQAAQRFNAAVIAVEPTLDWTSAQRGNEEILLNQALTAPKLLLGATLGSAQGTRDAAPLRPLENVDAAGLPEFPEIVAAPNARLFPLAICGVTNLPAGAAPIREAPLLFRRRAEVLASFSLQALALWLELTPGEISATPGSTLRLGDHVRIAVDRAGRALVGADSLPKISRISYDDLLLLANQPAPPPAPPALAAMKGGLVILGRTDRATRVYPIPSGERISAAEVQAWAVQSLRDRPALRRGSLGWDIIITLIAAAHVPMIWRASRLRVVLWSAGTLGVYAIAALCAFEANGLWLPAALPAGLTLCLAACRFLL